MASSECSICYEHIEKTHKTKLSCNHVFHTNCIYRVEIYAEKEYYKNRANKIEKQLIYKCPYCRYEYNKSSTKAVENELNEEEKEIQKQIVEKILQKIENKEKQKSLKDEFYAVIDLFEFIRNEEKIIFDYKFGFQVFVRILIPKYFELNNILENKIPNFKDNVNQNIIRWKSIGDFINTKCN